MRAAIIVLWLLNIWDAIATWYAVKVAHYGHEANPTMAWAIDLGPWMFFGIKIGAMTAVAALLMRLSPYSRTSVSGSIIGVAVAVYSAIALWHVYAFFFWR